MKSIAAVLFAAVAFAVVPPLESSAQWRSTAWTMDFKNDTGRCISLTVGAEGAPPIDAAVVWAHRGQHFDDNHTNVAVHAKIYERDDCTGRFIADLHEPMHRLRNILTVTQAGPAFALQRRETPDAEPASPGVTLPPGPEDGENFHVGPSYRMQTIALQGIRLGDSARAVAALARALPKHDIRPATITFTTAAGAAVTARLRGAKARVWSVTSQAATPTPRAAAVFARAALASYGEKPTTQVSGPFIRLRYCMLEAGADAARGRASCAHAAARLEVYAAVPLSRIELQ